MKRTVKRALALAMGLILLVSLMMPQALASSSGKLDSNLTWKVDGSTLTISGKGAMADFDTGEPPWEKAGTPTYKIKKIVIKEGVTSLCDYAFDTYEQVNSISLPRSLKKLGFMALNGTNLKEVKVAKGSKYFSTKGGVLFNRKKTTLIYYPTQKKGSSYAVPSGVKTIAVGAFCGAMDIYSANPHLKKLVIPKSVKTIKRSAFSETKITTFKFLGANPKIEKGAFYGANAKILYPKNHRKCWKPVIEALKKEYANSGDEDNAETLLTFECFS